MNCFSVFRRLFTPSFFISPLAVGVEDQLKSAGKTGNGNKLISKFQECLPYLMRYK